MTRCKVCKCQFTRKRMNQKVCETVECAATYATNERIKAQAKELRKRKEAIKTKSQLAKEAQIEFNHYIRERDHDLPCISCGRHHAGAYDAGHYRSVGAAPQLRFDEDNCHKQCVPCNQYKSGNAIEYRIGLVNRLGADRVERLEGRSEPSRYTREDFIYLKSHYRAKWKALEKERK